MKGRITYLLFMFIVGRIIIQTACTSRKMFTCGKSAHCTIVMTEEKVWSLKLSDLQIDLSVFLIQTTGCFQRKFSLVSSEAMSTYGGDPYIPCK